MQPSIPLLPPVLSSFRVVWNGPAFLFFVHEFSHLPKTKFTQNTAKNVEKGNAVWNSWFGEEAPGANGLGSPLNTACFCDITTCEDDR